MGRTLPKAIFAEESSAELWRVSKNDRERRVFLRGKDIDELAIPTRGLT
jgi:hypothetical protein